MPGIYASQICNPINIPNSKYKTLTVSLLLTLSLTLRIRVPLLLTLKIFHVLHDVKYAKIRALYWKNERKVISLTD